MCTVSFIYKGGKDFILTSNRDEGVGRKTIVPQCYKNEEGVLLYPKDSVAGGTWIGVSDKNRLLCLLNGAFDNHIKRNDYVKSRGLLVKELLVVDDLIESIKKVCCDGIEPFTLLVVDWSTSNLLLYELVWDGAHKNLSVLPLISRIWSSSTLYTDEMKNLRKEWFSGFLNNSKEVSSKDVWDFHEYYSVGDKNIDLQIDRGNLKTVSITSVVKNKEVVSMCYKDLQRNEVFNVKLNSELTVNG